LSELTRSIKILIFHLFFAFWTQSDVFKRIEWRRTRWNENTRKGE